MAKAVTINIDLGNLKKMMAVVNKRRAKTKKGKVFTDGGHLVTSRKTLFKDPSSNGYFD